MGAMRIHGEVVRLEPGHGFGFIHDDHFGDWFFVAAGVRGGGVEALRTGQRVTFQCETTFSGPRATDIAAELV